LKVMVSWVPQKLAGGWVLQLTYTVLGDIARLCLPEPAESRAMDGLWAHTCFEAFFSEPPSAAYREFNFSPSTQWAHYRFSTERTPDPSGPAPATPVVQSPEVSHNRLVMTASVAAKPVTQLETLFSPTAVLELTDGSLSYWAVNHPAPLPDFHARAGWTTPLGWAIV
jgi:hypothetical protein